MIDAFATSVEALHIDAQHFMFWQPGNIEAHRRKAPLYKNICLIYEYMFLYFVRKVKWKLGKEGDKQGEELLDKNKKTGLLPSLQLVDFDEIIIKKISPKM
ncbi:hypothetical protein AB4J90_05590 [Geobacillus thermodenitrificans]|jgi:hypothetical protein|uniref:Uncharacterized protein n=2 Tax=Anoxybacillaceae TaxID=3120669 RepID=A0A150M2L4_9BACL|nr:MULTISPECIES: hypothetical protein [Bacillaceae]KYD18768.1 hypothetical protein B4119_4017 [Parageobacillus caldoxylosilyticus]WMV78184.1 hypothetical protein HSX42_05250 [Geobacillus thermodenitrificans]